jgi:hypothetical protein
MREVGGNMVLVNVSTAEPVYSRFFKDDSAIGANSMFDQDYFSEDDSIRLYPHSHHFNNLPLTLKKKNEDVRLQASNYHDGDRQPPKDRQWKNAEGKVE